MIINVDNLEKISDNRLKLERILKLKIIIREKEVTIEGKPEDEFIGEKVINALDFDFPVDVALMIKRDDFLFEILNIKDFTRRKDLEIVRARIIGTGGKTLRTLNNLTGCYFEIKDNEVGVIGAPEKIKNAQDAVVSIIQGAKQANVYSYLEKHQVRPIEDLGLKEPKKKGKKAKE